MIKKVLRFFKFSKQEEFPSTEEKINNLYDSLESESIVVFIGSDLENFSESFCESIAHFRESTKEESGFILPPVRVKSDLSLQENEILIKINNKTVIQDFAIPTKMYVETNFQYLLNQIYKNNLEDIFANNVIEKYINYVQQDNCWLVWNLTGMLSLVEIKIILIDLIKHGKSINNITYIFEKICEQIYVEDSYLIRKPYKISERLRKIL